MVYHFSTNETQSLQMVSLPKSILNMICSTGSV